jgi:hypothetical protein
MFVLKKSFEKKKVLKEAAHEALLVMVLRVF